MKNFASSITIIAGMFAAILGAAAPAEADLGSVIWNNQMQHQVYVPHVDTTVQHSR